LLRSRKAKVIFGQPFYYQEVASQEDNLREIARKIMERAGSLVNFPSREKYMTYKDIKDRAQALETKEVKELLNSLPIDIKEKLIGCYLDPSEPGSEDVLNYFLDNSEMTRLIKASPGSSEAFEFLYQAKKVLSPIDEYFLKCPAGRQIYTRLKSLEVNLPKWIDKIYKDKNSTVLIDNIGSGPGRDMIHVLQKNPGLKDKVKVRNIDINKEALEAGKDLVERLGLTDSFSYINKSFHKVKPRQADLILLIGFLCPLKLHTCERVLDKLLSYSRPGGYIIYSTAQYKLLYDDPLTDFLMQLAGWQMSYKSDKEALALAKESGWQPISQFFDEPLHHHCMTVARSEI
jgi:hypothetical protein